MPLTNSNILYKEILSLPFYTGITTKEQDIVIESIKSLKKFVPLSNLNKGIVCFASDVPNKNFEFILKVLKKINSPELVTIINPKEKIKDFKCVTTTNN